MNDPSWPWDFWQAIGAVAAAVGTFFTAFVAWWQIGELKKQQRKWETLKACERYDTDPIITESLLALRDANDSHEFAKDPRKYRFYASTILNYLDGIAIGVRQKFYDPLIVRDHLEPIIRFHFHQCLSPSIAEKMEVHPSEFSKLADLLKEWDNDVHSR